MKFYDTLYKKYGLRPRVLGIGDWGLGIGDWGLGPIPNPQSPIIKIDSMLLLLFTILNIFIVKSIK